MSLVQCMAWGLPQIRVLMWQSNCKQQLQVSLLVWGNVLAADHHPSKCEEAVTQVADLVV